MGSINCTPENGHGVNPGTEDSKLGTGKKIILWLLQNGLGELKVFITLIL
jgi:hypothetical protein